MERDMAMDGDNDTVRGHARSGYGRWVNVVAKTKHARRESRMLHLTSWCRLSFGESRTWYVPFWPLCRADTPLRSVQFSQQRWCDWTGPRDGGSGGGGGGGGVWWRRRWLHGRARGRHDATWLLSTVPTYLGRAWGMMGQKAMGCDMFWC